MMYDLSTKNLITRTENDPWNAVTGRRPGSYQIAPIGYALIEQIDHALFERDLERALMTGFVFERWAAKDHHFHVQSPSVMASIYTICDMKDMAEKKLRQAKRRVDKQRSKEGKAIYYQRRGIHLIYSKDPRESVKSYDRAVLLFEELGNSLETAKSLMGRGVAKSILEHYEDGLADEERALDLIGTEGCIYIVMGSINASAILTKLGKGDLARERIDETQLLLQGMKNMERPKILIRWIKSLLMEGTGKRGDLKRAGQMMDRIEQRMKKLEMKAELRVLLADRARIARDHTTIVRIASKAYEMEESPQIISLIKAVIDHPTKDTILAWRHALDAYIPPFPVVA